MALLRILILLYLVKNAFILPLPPRYSFTMRKNKV